jgi:4,5-DOPA dioxygenase extradiol
MYPEADVPVVQLSLDSRQPGRFHYELAKELRRLRDEGVLIVGSGNIVHNLRRIDWSRPDDAFDWTRRFDDEVAEIMTSSPSELVGVGAHPDFDLAVPTPDHFLPAMYIAGLAAAGGETAHVLVDGYAMGSLSMVSYTLGCDELEPEGEGGAPPLPDVPPEETNI